MLSLVRHALNEVGDVHGHLVDAGVVELFDVVEGSLVLVSHKVNGDALSAETTAAADPEKKDKKMSLLVLALLGDRVNCLTNCRTQ